MQPRAGPPTVQMAPLARERRPLVGTAARSAANGVYRAAARMTLNAEVPAERRTTPNSGSFPAARLRRAVPTRGRRSLAGASLCLVAWAPRRAPSRNCTLMRAGVQADPIMKVFPGGGRHRPPEAGETRTPDASWVPNRVLLMRLRGGICSPARHQHADRPPRSALLLVHQRHRRSSVPRRGSLSPAGAPEAAPRRPRRAAPCQLRSDGRPGRAS